MHSKRCNPELAARQHGAVLVVSLLLLLVMTVLALTASQATRMQERMAGNARDLDLSFQAGEAGLRAAEIRIDQRVAPKGRAVDTCSDRDACDAESRDNAGALDFVDSSEEWWLENAHALGKTLAEVSAEPHYFTEVWADVPDTLTMGSSIPKSGTIYYVNTSRAAGATDKAVTVVETAYAVRY
jgi:type IV pilus assembly protein PilX